MKKAILRDSVLKQEEEDQDQGQTSPLIEREKDTVEVSVLLEAEEGRYLETATILD